MKSFLALATVFSVCAVQLQAELTIRARDYVEARELAEKSGNDIVVLQRGSDWNRLGENLYQNIWLKPEFVAALGDGYVLVDVDRPEVAGAPSLLSPDDRSAWEHFSKVTAAGADLPENQISKMGAEGGASFSKREDGTWAVDDPKGEHNPATDILHLQLEPKPGGRILRFDFPPDASLPNACAGRATNGNFVLSEVEISQGGTALKAVQAWANAPVANMLPEQAIDGIADQKANGWNSGANSRQPRTLMIVLEKPITFIKTLEINLIAHSQWGQHVPGSVRAALLNDEVLAAEIARVNEVQALATRNATFDWWDGGHCPRVALLDSAGRAVAAEPAPRADLTPETLAERVKELQKKRRARDEYLLLAEREKSGPQKAEFFRRAFDVLDVRGWAGNGKCYQPILDAIKAADPDDESGVQRWMAFGTNPRGGVPWAKPAWNEALDTQKGTRTLTDADYEEALARVDKELADPRNKILSAENIQRIMMAKFHIYRSWKGHEDKKFDAQLEIAEFDPTTFWGIGATGYCAMHRRGPAPMLTYGWAAAHVKPGANIWTLTDTAYQFDHPGHYQFTLGHAGGPDTLKIKRVSLVEKKTGAVLAEDTGEADLGPGPLARWETILDCSKWSPDGDYVLNIDYEAAEGHTNSVGNFGIQPWLVEPDPKPATGVKTDYAKLQQNLKEKLHSTLSASPGSFDPALASESARAELAVHELLRRCGADHIQQLSEKHGGEAFLNAFTGNPAWMEAFLANDRATWPDAIENLRLLHANALEPNSPFPKPLADHPFYRKVATAMALAAGKMNRYRLLDRFKDIVRVHREGLMHASFDSLDEREMRWALYLPGTALDFQRLVDNRQTRYGEYLGACWAIPYVGHNVYGDSVQHWTYASPWTHHYGTGSGDRPYAAQLIVGGVCGTLSGYGSAAARTHGVMASTVGQPGHCAYIVRRGQSWATGNDVSGPESNKVSVFEGTGFASMNRLYEVMHADKKGFFQSSRLSWAAHVFQDMEKPAEADRAWHQSIAAQPINYHNTLEYIKSIEAAPEPDKDQTRKLILQLADEYAPYHEAGWALINRLYNKVAPALEPGDRMALLLECHGHLKQDNAPLFQGYNVNGVLNLHAASLGDPALENEFFSKLLAVHHSADPGRNRVFAYVLGWGRARFAAKPETAATFAKTLGTFFASQGESADVGQMTAQFTAGIRDACKKGDAASYKIWADLAANLLPEPDPAHVYLKPEHVAAAPKIEPFGGDLLSKDGLLQTSSVCKYDKPLSYPAVLDGSAPGWFDTNAEPKPWAQVVLAGDAEISGLVLVNRYEFAGHAEFDWIVPFKVLVSADGIEWTEIATCGKAEPAIRVDLTGKAPRARYVRIERQPPADPATAPGRLHLRNFLVYGKKLY